VPTAHPRIQVTNDPELAETLARVARFYAAGTPASQIVRDLAIKGAEVVEAAENRRAEAIEWLIDASTKRADVLDWDALDRVDELAWGYPPDGA
jgi:hypothetical protein